MAEEPRGPVVRERDAVGEEPTYPAPEPRPGEAVREEPVYAPPEPRQREVVREVRYEPPPPQPRTSSLALASLATGISAYFIFPIAGAIAAIVTGFLAHNEIRASNGRLTGTAFATAGLVLGWLQIGLVILFIILGVALASAAPGLGVGLPGSLLSR